MLFKTKYQIVHFKYVQFVVHQWYLNKAVKNQIKSCIKINIILGMVVHAYNPHAWEAETGGLPYIQG